MKKKLFISLLIGGVFLALALKGVEWSALQEALGRANWLVVLFWALMMVVVQLIRATRWWILVDAAHPSPLRRIAPHGLVGFMAIVTLPLRAGEFVRPFLLKTRENIPFSAGLATCVVERIFDVLAMAVLLAIGLAAGPPAESIVVGGTEIDLQFLTKLGLTATLGGISFLVALMVFRDRVVNRIQSMVAVFSESLAEKISGTLHSFVQGLAILPDFRRVFLVALATCGVWGLTGGALWGICSSMGLDQVTGSVAFATLAVTMVGISIPAGPAFVGNYQLFCTAALGLYGVSEVDGLAVSILHHGVGFFGAVATGLPALGGVTGFVKLAQQAEADAS